MVFTKLTDTQKEELAIFKSEYGTNLTSSMRALVMRGSSINDAKRIVLSRQIARAELLEEMEKESAAQNELQEPPPAKPARKPRGPNKSKTVVEPAVEPADNKELKSIPEEEERNYKHTKIIHPKAKPKKEPKTKAKQQED